MSDTKKDSVSSATSLGSEHADSTAGVRLFYVLDTSKIAGPALHGLREFLSVFSKGGMVDIVGRRDGKEYRFEADWAKYLKEEIR